MIRRNFFKNLFGGTAPLWLFGVAKKTAATPPPSDRPNPATGSMASELPVGFAEILRLEPNDVIVVTLRGRLMPEDVVRIKASVKSHFPGHGVVVKDDSIDISIIKG